MVSDRAKAAIGRDGVGLVNRWRHPTGPAGKVRPVTAAPNPL